MENLRINARKGQITDIIKVVSEKEGVSPEFILDGIKKGTIIIAKNKKHKIEPIAIGDRMSVKINANIGSSPSHMSLKEEIDKLQTAIKYGADTVMDLSIGSILNEVRKKVMEISNVPVGTVPLYQSAFELSKKHIDTADAKIDDFLDIIKSQAEEGIDFMTIHCGLTYDAAEKLFNEGRVLNVVSRGGSILVDWMRRNKKENPLYEHYDKVLDILREYDITISLGDGLRPGAVSDATDRGQIQELINLGELTQRAWERDVQVMIEGPGHVPLNMIKTNIEIQKYLCHNAPFYVLGPIVTDSAPGYDHITGAIGGALAAFCGADFLCYVTPAEHLKLPSVDDVRDGVIASKIAAHAADIARGRKESIARDLKMSEARCRLDWEKQFKLAIDPDKAINYRNDSKIDSSICSMCGDFCAIKRISDIKD